MKRLEKASGIVAKFSMIRGEAPVLVLSQPHLIQEIQRCCVNLNTQSPRSVLCKFFSNSVELFLIPHNRYRHNFQSWTLFRYSYHISQHSSPKSTNKKNSDIFRSNNNSSSKRCSIIWRTTRIHSSGAANFRWFSNRK